MAISSTGLIVEQTLRFAGEQRQEPAPPRYTIRLSRPEIALLCRHEADLGIPTRGGLYVPKTADQGNRWFGVVLAVGPNKYGRSCCPDLRFGDLVELSRWTGTMWQRYPLATMFGQFGEDAKVMIKNPDPEGVEQIEMGWTDQYAAQSPDHIAYKIADAGWLFRRHGRKPGAYPIADRVFVEFEKQLKSKTLEIVERTRPETIHGTVLDVGGDVESVAPGDRIVAVPERYTRIFMADGRHVYSIKQGDILCRS